MRKLSINAGVIGALVLAASAVVAPQQAEAATITCPSNISGSVSGAIGCEYSASSNQDFLNTSPITVNADAFFGTNTWIYLDRDNLPDGAGQTGTYNVGALPADADQVMLIFKDGGDTYLVGYLLGPNVSSGTWSSPFQAPPFGGICGPREPTDAECDRIKDVSHISYYYTVDGGTTPDAVVSEPMSLALFGLGLAGLGLVRRRRAA